jgi:Leu/Phe-tRNA-protein transferase
MSTAQRQIPYITLEDISKETLDYYIYPNMDVNYYWSNDFSPQMYITLAQAGFISVSHVHDDNLLLLPEMQEEYAVLDFQDLHISRKVGKLIKKGGYQLEFNTRFPDVIASIQNAYSPCWLEGAYAELIYTLSQNSYDNFTLFSTELFDSTSNELIAGELGYITHNVYTSLSGFHKSDKQYENWGTLQLVLLGHHLESEGIRFWNLGHPHMEYKIDLGAKILNREDFLKRFIEN